MTTDPHNLDRFLQAQDPVYPNVLEELRAGRKRTHWMWFVFPQIAGLGRSATARQFAIASREEAVAYLSHRILGERLRECTRLVLAVEGRTAHEIFDSPDDLKFHSSMTLFAQVAADGLFQQALDFYFNSSSDPLTLERLNVQSSRGS